MPMAPKGFRPILCLTMIVLLSACADSDEPVQAKQNNPTALSAELMRGKQVVETTCIACHGQGLNGAPILGNGKMWAKRVPQGEATLVNHAINGYAYEMMPPRGGNPDLSDDDIRFAVRYMLSLLDSN